MKKIILTLFISIIIFAPNVSAEEISVSQCSSSINILPQPGLKKGKCTLTDNKFVCDSNSEFSYTDYIPVYEAGKYTFSYYSKSGYGSLSGAKIALLDENFNYISQTSLTTSSYVTTLSTTFDVTEDTKYLFLYTTSSNGINATAVSKYNSLQAYPKMQLEFSETFTDWTSYIENSCPIVEPEIPEEPETPTPDSTLDDFYTIFIEKMKTLSEFALDNKFVLSAIAILLVFVCLELFIYLFKGGGKR